MVKFKKILYPTDFSESSKESLTYAFELAEQYSAELHLLHVLPNSIDALVTYGFGAIPIPSDWDENVREEAKKQLSEILNDESRINITRATAEGEPFLGIIRYARENEIDLIVMATHGRSGFEHILMGSEAEKVVRKSPCPVLTVPPKDRVFNLP